jgi:hypothetical protein
MNFGAFFCSAKKPGFPLQVLGKRRCAFLWAFRYYPLRAPSDSSGIVYAKHKRFRWSASYAQFVLLLGVVSRLRRVKSKAPALLLWPSPA